MYGGRRDLYPHRPTATLRAVGLRHRCVGSRKKECCRRTCAISLMTFSVPLTAAHPEAFPWSRLGERTGLVFGAALHPQLAAFALLRQPVATLAQLLPSLRPDIDAADRRQAETLADSVGYPQEASEFVGRQLPTHLAGLFGDGRGFGGSEPVAPYPAS